MNKPSSGASQGRTVDPARSIAWPDYEANLVLAQKTRRAVRDEVISTRERRMRQLRIVGFALTGFLFLMVLLAPAIWNSLEDLSAGELLFDLPIMTAILVLMLFPAMLAALIAVWKGKQNVEHDRGGFETFRSTDR